MILSPAPRLRATLLPARAWVGAAVDLALPGVCALCGDVGAPLCRVCRIGLRACLHPAGPLPTEPTPPPAGMPSCWAAGVTRDELRGAVTAYKDEGRRDLRAVLAALLAGSARAAAGGPTGPAGGAGWGGPVLVVPVPGSRRSRRTRGDVPLEALAADAAAATPEAVLAPALRTVRALRDQSGLGSRERAANLAGALEVLPRWSPAVRGRRVVVVDDVVTTGATLAEAARALRACGASEVTAAVVAATTLSNRLPGPAGRASVRT